jgi:hypothetical protein
VNVPRKEIKNLIKNFFYRLCKLIIIMPVLTGFAKSFLVFLVIYLSPIFDLV